MCFSYYVYVKFSMYALNALHVCVKINMFRMCVYVTFRMCVHVTFSMSVFVKFSMYIKSAY